LGLGVLGASAAQSAAAALFWISVALGGLSAASPVGWSIPSLIAPKESVGTVGGILNFCNQVSGIAAPIATGYVVQATHSFFLGLCRSRHLPADRNCRIRFPFGVDGARTGAGLISLDLRRVPDNRSSVKKRRGAACSSPSWSSES